MKERDKMDYNSYPWAYEVIVCGVGESYKSNDESLANYMYDQYKTEYPKRTVLLTHSRLGVVKGTPGL